MTWLVREKVLPRELLVFLFRQCGQRVDEEVEEMEEELDWCECRSLMGLRGGRGGGGRSGVVERGDWECWAGFGSSSCLGDWVDMALVVGSSGIALCTLAGWSSLPVSGALLMDARDTTLALTPPVLLVEVTELVLRLLVVLPTLHVLGGRMGGLPLSPSPLVGDTATGDLSCGGDPLCCSLFDGTGSR